MSCRLPCVGAAPVNGSVQGAAGTRAPVGRPGGERRPRPPHPARPRPQGEQRRVARLRGRGCVHARGGAAARHRARAPGGFPCPGGGEGDGVGGRRGEGEGSLPQGARGRLRLSWAPPALQRRFIGRPGRRCRSSCNALLMLARLLCAGATRCAPRRHASGLQEAAAGAGLKWDDFMLTDNTCGPRPPQRALLQVRRRARPNPFGPRPAAHWARRTARGAPRLRSRVLATQRSAQHPHRPAPTVSPPPRTQTPAYAPRLHRR